MTFSPPQDEAEGRVITNPFEASLKLVHHRPSNNPFDDKEIRDLRELHLAWELGYLACQRDVEALDTPGLYAREGDRDPSS